MPETQPLTPTPRRQPPVVSYGTAALSVAVAVTGARLLDLYLVTAPASLFLCAIMFSAWFGGIKAGIAAAGLSHLAFVYYFVAPTHSLMLSIQELPRVVIFSLSSLFVLLLSAAQKKAAESLERTNQRLHAEMAERRQAEDAMHTARAELAHVARVTTLGEMAASIAHEVDQPLSGVVINANASLRFLTGPAPNLDEVRDGLQAIARDGRRASDVIGRIRALARRAPNEKAALDVNQVIRDVVAVAAGEVRRTRATLRTEAAPDLPAVVADRVQLEQVVLNLLINGLDAMQCVEDRPREMVITTQRDAADRVHVAIRDTGAGIDPQLAHRLFEPFYTTKAKGMGLGLSISRSIVEQHGGRLWAVPNDGPGTTFHFTV
jgi:C4-dicarboxylate-specific signal transduction histidine kinase